MSTALITNPASEKQISFLRSLFEEAQKGFALASESDPSLVERLTPDVARVQSTLVAVVGNQPVDKRDASDAIGTLKAVNEALRSFVLKTTLPPGLAPLSPERVISNKYAKGCSLCDNAVPVAEGFAVQSRGAWRTVCKPCAEETAEAREERLAAERAERLAEAEAERAEARAKADAARAQADRILAEERARRAYVEAFAVDLFDRAGVSDQVKPDLHVAIPSATGNNDLDFFRVVRVGRNQTQVYRIIGGHNDQRLALAQAESALWALVLTEDVAGALATYGREIGRCGVCHRSLTDEESRSVGLGPVCASKIGF